MKTSEIFAKYYKHVVRIFLFILACVLMIWSFPDNTKYRYIYELHRPWRYANVIAPFDFPVYKTDAELTAERDSLIENFHPYYRRESVKDISAQVDLVLLQNKSRIQMMTPTNVSGDSLRQYLFAHLTNRLSEVYERGIIEIPEEINPGDNEQFELMVISGNILEPCVISEFLTLKEAYKQVIIGLKRDMRIRYGNVSQWQFLMIDKLPLEGLLVANIVYDRQMTASSQADAIEKISLTQGRVLAGQKIISTGDIVDEQTGKILESLRRIYEPQSAENQIVPIYIGESLMVVALLTSVFLFLMFFRNDIFEKLNCVLFILVLMTAFVVFSGLLFSAHSYVNFVVPYVILPIVLRLFLDSRLAMYMHTVTMFLVSFMAENTHLFLLMHIPAGMIAIITLANLTRRGQIVRTAVFVYIAYVMIYAGYNFWQSGELTNINPNTLLKLAINCFLVFMSYPLIYIFEKIFGFYSDVTLMELSDTNSKLLRDLSERAPGSFQHSVQVANLSASVAYRLGANTMLVRAGAMYHDIGKISAPMYFTENQAHNINPHNDLDELESAQIVIKHVQEGVRLAEKHGIPKPIVDIIRSHHGDSLVRYFYINYCKKHEGEEVNENDFRYSGPVPQTKEEVIVMMCDAVEAASKSLSDYSDEAIDNLVEKIIDMQFKGGGYRESPITFKDISTTKEVLKGRLKSIYKGRIKYPEK